MTPLQHCCKMLQRIPFLILLLFCLFCDAITRISHVTTLNVFTVTCAMEIWIAIPWNYRSRSYFMTVSQSVCLGIEHASGTCDQILLSFGMLLSEICGLVSMQRPLWREDGSAICGVITQWSESRRTRNHTLLSHLRLAQPGGPGSHIYIPQEQGGPVKPPGTGFPLRRVLRLAGYGECIPTLPLPGRTGPRIYEYILQE
jgi:hypothetical protein